MHKSLLLSLFLFCCYFAPNTAQITESEVLPEGVLFARYTDSQRPANPIEGLCFYNTDAKSMECYDGFVWRTLCGTPTTTSNVPLINCPTASFVLDECMLTVSWTHNDPLSTSVNYDLRVNGQDPGLSVTYPTMSNTIDICNTLGVNSGSGTINLDVEFWYDGDFGDAERIRGCTINYSY